MLKSTNKKLGLLALAIPLVFLPGCFLTDWFKGKSSEETESGAMVQGGREPLTVASDDTVIASMNGKPIISAESLDKNFNQLLEDNPQLKAVLPLMPNAKHDVFMGMVSQAVVDEYVQEKGIESKAEYKKELNNMIKSVKSMLNTKYFGLDHPVEVSDAEVKKFYEENKAAMPDLLLSHGGVKASGVSFATEAEAQAFADKVKTGGFAKSVADAALKDKVNDFKFVNVQSLGIDPTLRAKITMIKKVPVTEVIKDSTGKFWVVNASEIEAPKYRPFEQVKAGIKQFVEKEKRTEALCKEIDKLKKSYNVEINEDYFKQEMPAAGAQEQEMPIMQMPEAPVENAQIKQAPKAARSA